mmetsp:Transcript_35437/g.46656  ORF Transcript_35437/g.46656 Transcript_35437/m.46656 type:complete len:99 (-) Transcript_35437:104-400(-)
METVRATSEACLLQLKIIDLENMAKVKQAAGQSLRSDYDTLMGFLVQNYESKQNWRREVGIVSMSPRATRNRFIMTLRSKNTATDFANTIATLGIRHP